MLIKTKTDNIENIVPFVIRDTREKKNVWKFIKSEHLAGTKEKSLETGDITLERYEHIFSLERKATTGELAGNITTKQFENELKRASKLRHFYVICEFSLAQIMQFPYSSGIPQKFWKKLRVTPKFFLKKIVEFECRYNVKFIFAGDGETAKEYARAIFKEMIKLYSDEINGNSN